MTGDGAGVLLGVGGPATGGHRALQLTDGSQGFEHRLAVGLELWGTRVNH